MKFRRGSAGVRVGTDIRGGAWTTPATLGTVLYCTGRGGEERAQSI